MFNQMHNIENPKKYPIGISLPKGTDTVSIVQPLNNAKSGLFIMKEIWRGIKEYKKKYQVSNYGRIRSLDTKHTKGSGNYFRKGRILKQYKNQYNGFTKSFTKNRKRNTLQIHYLVAVAFIPNPNNYKEINHKDGSRQNNHVENLEWCTRSQNVQHAYDIGLKTGSWKGKFGKYHNRSKNWIGKIKK